MRRSQILFTAVAAAILAYQLILPPVVGVADNGDSAKVVGRFNLFGHLNLRGQYIDTVWEIRPDKHWVGEFYSSEILLVAPAVAVNWLLSKDGNFDLRLIGVVHGALFVLALWLLVPLLDGLRRGPRILMYALILFVYCDVMYVSGFNSFYMDEPAFVFLMLSTVLFMRVLRWHGKLDAALFVASLLLLLTAKTQHAILGFWIALLLLATRKLLWPKRSGLFAGVAALAVLASLAMIWKGSAPHFADDNVYNLAFSRILPQSKDVTRTLAELGLDDSYRAYIGKNAFSPGSRMDDEAFRSGFRGRISMLKVGVFYLRHPAEMYRDLRTSLAYAGRQREFGNFDKSAGYAPGAESGAFAEWSNFKRHHFYGHGSRYFFAIIGSIAVVCALVWALRRRLPPVTPVAVAVLTGMTITEVLISSLADPLDIARHHQIFYALFDMLLLVGVWAGLSGWAPRQVKD